MSAQNGGDTCADAVLVTPGIYSDAAITPGSGSATQATAADALWYSYTAEADGTTAEAVGPEHKVLQQGQRGESGKDRRARGGDRRV